MWRDSWNEGLLLRWIILSCRTEILVALNRSYGKGHSGGTMRATLEVGRARNTLATAGQETDVRAPCVNATPAVESIGRTSLTSPHYIGRHGVERRCTRAVEISHPRSQ